MFFLAGFALLIAAVDARATEARVEGVSEDLRAILANGSLAVGAATRADPAATPQDIVAAARADYANLLGLLYGEGYYGPEIHIYIDGREASAMSPLSVPARIGAVVIRVAAGRQFTFGRAAIAPLAPRTELPEAFAPGKPARAELIREAVGTAIDGWREVGHAKAEVGDRRIVARHPAAQLDAEVQVRPGPELRFGRLIISGNQRVRADRIREIAGLPGGRVYSPETLRTVARRLRETGAFTSVALDEAETANADGTLDISATVIEDLPRRFGFGAELSSLEGLTLSGYWMHRNFLGGAERFRIDAEAAGIGGGTGSIKPNGSGVDYKLGFSFARPGTFSPANTLTLRGELAQEDEPLYFSRSALAELGLTRELSENTEITAALAFRYSEVEDDLGKRKFRHVMLPLTGQRDKRDKPLDAREGYYLRLEATPYLGISGSESGGRLYGDARYYLTPGGETGRFTFAGRLQAGAILGSSLVGTPPEFLFWSGGGGTVRGQPYQSLYVESSNGDYVGGQSFLGVSAEARVRVTRNIGVVAFYDYGQVGADAQLGGGGSHAGAGLGLRYDTPLGPIRLDVATPVSGDTGDGVQVYIGIGQAF